MLELKNICKQYQQTTIIDHLSVTFPDTGMIGIQGKSGCGKSTLLYIMGMLDEDYQGEIFYNGEKITDRKAFVSQHVSFMMQNKDYFLANKIVIEIENSDFFVATDEKWVIFILNQILNNSIKYMDKDEKKIKIQVIEDKNKVILEIRDNGCGIKESDISRMFEKGFTGSNRKKEHSTGMGLYLCRKLCDRLHLNINIESKEKEYTTVSIIFPKSSLHE